MNEKVEYIGDDADYPIEVIRERNRKINEWRENFIDEHINRKQLFSLFNIEIGVNGFQHPIYAWGVERKIRKAMRVHQYNGLRADNPPAELVEMRRQRVEKGLGAFEDEEIGNFLTEVA